MAEVIEEGTTERRGDARLRHFLLRLPRPVERVWAAVATPQGLREWLTAVDLEPRLGGAVALRLPEGTAPGRVTAWDVERVAEYTVEGRGRVRFHLEPAPPGGTTVRFTYESQPTESGREPDWRGRFEQLARVLGGESPASGA